MVVIYSQKNRYSTIKKILPDSAKAKIYKSKWFRKFAFSNVKEAQIDKALESEIRDFLRPDVIALRKLTGKTFDNWSL